MFTKSIDSSSSGAFYCFCTTLSFSSKSEFNSLKGYFHEGEGLSELSVIWQACWLSVSSAANRRVSTDVSKYIYLYHQLCCLNCLQNISLFGAVYTLTERGLNKNVDEATQLRSSKFSLCFIKVWLSAFCQVVEWPWSAVTMHPK